MSSPLAIDTGPPARPKAPRPRVKSGELAIEVMVTQQAETTRFALQEQRPMQSCPFASLLTSTRRAQLQAISAEDGDNAECAQGDIGLEFGESSYA
jgi:hypothetical protein